MQVSKRSVVATIAISTTTSGVIDLTQRDIVGLYIPAAFTGTAITFTASSDIAGTFGSVRDGAGNAISVTVAAGQYIKINSADFLGVLYLKLVSGSSEAAARDIRVSVRPIA